LWLSGLVRDLRAIMCQVAIGDADEAALAAKFAVMRPFPDGRGWRMYVGDRGGPAGLRRGRGGGAGGGFAAAGEAPGGAGQPGRPAAGTATWHTK
jgi:hypothetical protein